MGSKIAVVEDDDCIRELVEAILTERGYTVQAYEGVEQARHWLPGFAPDLVVCDVELGDGCGLDLVHQLRDEGGHAFPAIILSSLKRESDIVRGFAAGAVDYLAKPFSTDELLARCAVHLARSSQAARARVGAVDLPGKGGLAFGRYRVVRELGRGGYGQVFLAWDEQRGGQRAESAVALKVLAPLAGEQVEARVRFVRETYAASRLRDAQVASVLDVGSQEGRLYYAMEFVDGPSLHRRVQEEGPLTEHQALRLLRGLLRALVALDAAGIVHRDIKPDNVVLRGGRIDDPVLVDFGLAKLPFDRGVTNPDFIMGTPAYLAPEVIQGREADRRSDLFQVGLVLRHALEGVDVFPHLQGLALMNAIAAGPIPPVQAPVSRSTARLLSALLAGSPADRPQSAARVLAIVEGLLSSHATAPTETTPRAGLSTAGAA